MNFYSPFAQPVEANLHNPFKTRLSALGSGAVDEAPTEFDFYVDSVNGSNANDGLTIGTAKQTIAAAQALMSAGTSLGLVRGSKWRETFTFQHANITIGVAGSGAAPILDCRDLAGAWTQPDAGTYPDVWSQSWTRTSPASTGSAFIWIWADDVAVSRAASSLADLQTNGGAHFVSRTATTTTVSIKSATDPNSNGVVYEIGKRGWSFNGHSTSLGSAAPGNQKIYGPIETVGGTEHYNALSGGPGQSRSVLIRDGNIHHSVTEGDLTQDVLASGIVPGITGSMLVAYRIIGTGFNHTFRRCLTLCPSGTTRSSSNSGLYCHGSTPTTLDSMLVDQCITRGGGLTGDASALTVTNLYTEEAVLPVIGCATSNLTVTVNRVQIQDLTTIAEAGGSSAFRCLSSVPAINVSNLCAHTTKGSAFVINAATTPPVISNIALTGNSGGITGGAGALQAPLTLNYSVITSSGRALNLIVAPYVGNFNVFMFTAADAPLLSYNGAVGGLSAWQTATGQDSSSVYLKPGDQTAGNANAFWLGVSTNANAGPAAGDWRINPSAKVYNAAGTALFGTFADGVTPLTLAGPQEHWNYNTRSVVAGPPTRLLTLPSTKAEERTYIDDPTAWDFYP